MVDREPFASYEAGLEDGNFIVFVGKDPVDVMDEDGAKDFVFRLNAAHDARIVELERVLTKAQEAVGEFRERAAQVLDHGVFLYTDSPEAKWARRVATLIRALPTEPEGEK